MDRSCSPHSVHLLERLLLYLPQVASSASSLYVTNSLADRGSHVLTKHQSYLPQEPEGGEGKDMEVKHVLLWEFKADSGFPESEMKLKVLKQRLRNEIEPSKDLGHSDNHGKGSVKSNISTDAAPETTVVDSSSQIGKVKLNSDGTPCEDCR